MTQLAAAITVHSLDQAFAHAAKAAEHGADLVEYRIDSFTDQPAEITTLVERSPLPCIITCRPTWEGGAFDGHDTDRISALEHAGVGARQPAYVDVELLTWQKSANIRQKVKLIVDHADQVRPVDTGLILSSHDFETRPVDLYQRLEAMAQAKPCRVVKLVWQARSLRDNIEAFEMLRQRPKPMIALCMGEAGLPSRVLAKKFGGLLTFAAVDKDAGTAPGQPTLDELKNLYRWDAINADTRVYGVIGWPVGHSKSPHYHNARFTETGHNGVYLPMPIPPEYEHFKATLISWLDADWLHFRGASVTIPHKENLLRFVAEHDHPQSDIEPLAAKIGAANTLTVRDDGSLYASNTDYAAALDAICEGLGVAREGLAGRRVAMLGAGGVARAIIAGLAHYGATIVIYNRTFEKAQALAEEFGQQAGAGSTQAKGQAGGTGRGTPGAGKVVAARLEKLCDSCCQVFINCTPIGMHPHEDATPIPEGTLKKGWGPDTLVFDTIYNPAQTKLLKQAAAAGCKTIEGSGMFDRQAAAQFELWTGQAG